MAIRDLAKAATFVKRYESSGGDYTAQNPGSSASGAYQFLGSTWRGYAANVPGASAYTRAKDAPPEVQDAVFAEAVRQRGLGDWTCQGCNPKLLAAYNAMGGESAFQNPSSISDGGGSSSDGGDYGGGGASMGVPDALGGAAGPDTRFTDPSIPPLDPTGPGSGAPGVGPAITGGLDQIGTWFKDQGIRLGIMVLGIVLVGIAALALAWGELGKDAPQAVKTAAKFAK